MSNTMAASRVTMRGPNGGGLKDAIELADASETSFWCPFCEGAQIGTEQDPPEPGAQCSKCGAHVVDVKPVRLERTAPAAAPDPEPAGRCAVCDGFIVSDEQSEWKLDGRPVHNICAGVVHPLVRRIEELEEELAASRKAYDDLVRQRARVMADVDATVDALRRQLAERDRTIEQMVGANEAHQKLLEEERRAANQARKMAGIRRERIKTLEARLRFAETRAEHWERRADRLGRLALEAMVPQARVGDPLFEAAAREGIEPLGPDDEDDLEPVGALS